MEMCRACLSTTEELIKLDQTSIQNYNLLTNISVDLTDGLPKSMCSTCTEAIKFYSIFRSKCIKAEDSLHYLFSEQKVKFENNRVLAAQEVKVEVELTHDYEDDCGYDFENTEEKVKVEVDQDLKPKVTKQIKRPKKKPVTPKTGTKTIKKKENKASVKKEKIDSYGCGLCPNTFKTAKLFTEHVEKHKKDKLICENCNDQFETWEPFLAHRFKHLDPEPLICHLCYRKFRLDVTYQNHFLIDHSKKVTELKCAWCDAPQKSRRALNKHVVIHTERRFTCDYCQQTYYSKSVLSNHIARHMSVKRHKCKLCKKRFKFAVGLYLHKLKFHTEGEFCTTCSKVFPDWESLGSHTCLKPLVCSVCGKMLLNFRRLKSHMNTHSTADKYKCNMCPFTCKWPSSLRMHKNKHEDRRPFQCSYCPMTFGYNAVLQKHIRTHTGEKPFVCEICTKGFTGKHNLRVHMKVHGLHLVVSKKSADEQSPPPKSSSFY